MLVSMCQGLIALNLLQIQSLTSFCVSLTLAGFSIEKKAFGEYLDGTATEEDWDDRGKLSPQETSMFFKKGGKRKMRKKKRTRRKKKTRRRRKKKTRRRRRK